jgi:hypothetical protein
LGLFGCFAPVQNGALNLSFGDPLSSFYEKRKRRRRKRQKTKEGVIKKRISPKGDFSFLPQNIFFSRKLLYSYPQKKMDTPKK